MQVLLKDKLILCACRTTAGLNQKDHDTKWFVSHSSKFDTIIRYQTSGTVLVILRFSVYILSFEVWVGVLHNRCRILEITVSKLFKFISSHSCSHSVVCMMSTIADSVFVPVEQKVFLTHARIMYKKAQGLSAIVERLRFTALFGVSPAVCSIVWKLIGDNHPHELQP